MCASRKGRTGSTREAEASLLHAENKVVTVAESERREKDKSAGARFSTRGGARLHHATGHADRGNFVRELKRILLQNKITEKRGLRRAFLLLSLLFFYTNSHFLFSFLSRKLFYCVRTHSA